MDLRHLLHGPNDPSAPGAIGRARAYEALSAVVFAGRRRRLYGRLVELSGARPGERALDIGCGTGYLVGLLAHAVAPGGTVTGIDPAAAMIDYARRHVRQDGCTFTQGLAEELPCADGSVDLVVSSLAFHHIPEDRRERALAEMFRVLRPGGRLLLADFRPPRGRAARRLVGATAGPAMRDNPVDLMTPMVRGAGFGACTSGDMRPFLHWVRAARPAAAASR
ncbi:class I SAM-dependent methyltransferase [Streptomyces sp. NBC_01803]|uniref:class I SAM-dependent methyltransferase n=1 Tax=Streptomyces sp. NBC_01803 TaxID=2975946 RepID=UPI002DDC1DFC|nr:class I SAM-dependent methyltransferase [Streptomyces sp. NBC_01803]WSA43667.1 class I SAM-dependent methyltransferase [Streptomyces sp. NBC_01803]